MSRYSFGYDIREGLVGIDVSVRVRFNKVSTHARDFLSIDPAFWPRVAGVEASIIEAHSWDGRFYFASFDAAREWLLSNSETPPSTIIRIDYHGSLRFAKKQGFFDLLITADRVGRLLGYDVVDWALWSVFNGALLSESVFLEMHKECRFNEFGLISSLRAARIISSRASEIGDEVYFPVSVWDISQWDGSGIGTRRDIDK